MLKSASPRVARFLIKRALSPGLAMLLKGMAGPALIGGGVGGLSGALGAEDSALTGGLTGALAGAGMGALGGLAGGVLGGRAGKAIGGRSRGDPIGRMGARVGYEQLKENPGSKQMWRLLGINPMSRKTTAQEMLGSGLGTMVGGGTGTLVGGGLGGLVGIGAGSDE